MAVNNGDFETQLLSIPYAIQHTVSKRKGKYGDIKKHIFLLLQTLWLKSSLLPHLTCEIKRCASQPTHTHFHTVTALFAVPTIGFTGTQIGIITNPTRQGENAEAALHHNSPDLYFRRL